MWEHHLLWRSDGQGKLIVEANGYTLIVQRLLPGSRATFTVRGHSGGKSIVISGSRATTRGAMSAGERVLIGTLPRPSFRSEDLLGADAATA